MVKSIFRVLVICKWIPGVVTLTVIALDLRNSSPIVSYKEILFKIFASYRPLAQAARASPRSLDLS